LGECVLSFKDDTGSFDDTGLAAQDEVSEETVSGDETQAGYGCSSAPGMPSGWLGLVLGGLVFARRRAGDIEVKSKSSVGDVGFRCRQQSAIIPKQETL
jgi:MYXO-CTERM domain-containing protein